jgi:ribonuclease R
MPHRYIDAILKRLSDKTYQPLKPRQLAKQMGIAEEQYGVFRQAVKQLRESGRIVLGAKDAMMLPEISTRLEGHYRPNPRGFGFVVPLTLNSHGDLFIPPGKGGGALNGDLVAARVHRQGSKDGKNVYSGEIVEIIQRAQNRFVGTLDRTAEAWFVLPDGSNMSKPIVVRDVGAAGPKPGSKVVVEIIKYGDEGQLPTGVLVETLGKEGELEVETQAVIRAHGLADVFSDAALADARKAVEAFDAAAADGREDLTHTTVITIDPLDARDYDDAISLTHPDKNGNVTLGVHIADVSHFIPENGDLDNEARQRSTSVYFPRRVVPMLPEILSNGVCSLQEGQRRFCKSAFITYDAHAKVVDTRFAETVISSAKRLTYDEAQSICDRKTGGHDERIVDLVLRMEQLARRIESRRRKAGMLHLELPEVNLVLDDNDKVVDAVPEDTSYSHTIIEMFMVEANEAVAELMNSLGRPILRRVHPSPDVHASKNVTTFIRACGHKLPTNLSRHDLQALLATVKGKPESYAVNLAVLKMFEQAEYAPSLIGHFALASEHYCHFTSPIRRYPDLTVHRMLAEHCRKTLTHRPPEDMSELVRLGEHCSAAERKAQAAENELREVLVLQLLQTKLGEVYDGVITGVTNFGMFVQLRQFLVDGLLRIEDIGDDWWQVDARLGQIRGEMSGKTFRIGDTIKVRLATVDVARRQLNVVPEKAPEKARARKSKSSKKAPDVAKKKAVQAKPKGKKVQTRRRKRGR